MQETQVRILVHGDHTSFERQSRDAATTELEFHDKRSPCSLLLEKASVTTGKTQHHQKGKHLKRVESRLYSGKMQQNFPGTMETAILCAVQGTSG